MSEPIREMILEALAERLRTVGGAGYSVNLTESVFRARRGFSADEIPAASIWDGNETAQDHYDSTRQDMDVICEVHAQHGDLNPSVVANRIIADVRKAMESHDAAVSALVESITYVGAAPTYPQDGEIVTSARVHYSVGYTTLRGDPYTSAL